MNAARLAAVLSLVATGPTVAQVIPDDIQCSGCSIRAELAALLKDESIAIVRDIFVDAQGRYWVTNNGDLPTLFDSRGNVIPLDISEGPGPMELQNAERVWSLPGDSIAILERGGKILVLSPDLTFHRTFTAPVFQINGSLTLRWPTAVMVNTEFRTPGQAGYPLHVLDLGADPPRVRRSFGSDGAVRREERYTAFDFVIAPSTNGSFWAAPQAEYTMTKWSRDFRPLIVIERRPPWFETRSNLSSGGPEIPPSPVLAGIVEDDNGLLWTFTRIAAPDWQKAWSRFPRDMPSGEVAASIVDWEYMYDTRIEVIDPATKRVLARHTLDRSIRSVLPGPRAAFYMESDIGEPEVRVVRMTLVR